MNSTSRLNTLSQLEKVRRRVVSWWQQQLEERQVEWARREAFGKALAEALGAIDLAEQGCQYVGMHQDEPEWLLAKACNQAGILSSELPHGTGTHVYLDRFVVSCHDFREKTSETTILVLTEAIDEYRLALRNTEPSAEGWQLSNVSEAQLANIFPQMTAREAGLAASYVRRKREEYFLAAPALLVRGSHRCCALVSDGAAGMHLKFLEKHSPCYCCYRSRAVDYVQENWDQHLIAAPQSAGVVSVGHKNVYAACSLTLDQLQQLAPWNSQLLDGSIIKTTSHDLEFAELTAAVAQTWWMWSCPACGGFAPSGVSCFSCGKYMVDSAMSELAVTSGWGLIRPTTLPPKMVQHLLERGHPFDIHPDSTRAAEVQLVLGPPPPEDPLDLQ